MLRKRNDTFDTMLNYAKMIHSGFSGSGEGFGYFSRLLSDEIQLRQCVV